MPRARRRSSWIDPHKDVHVADLTTVLGEVLAGCPFPATAEGYRQLLA